MSVGPIQAFVIGFPDNDMFEGRIAEELGRLSGVGQIRVIDAVVVTREGDDVAVLSVSDLDDEERAELRTVVGALSRARRCGHRWCSCGCRSRSIHRR